MNEEEKKQFKQLQKDVEELKNFIFPFKEGDKSLLKIMGRTSDTTPGGAIIISTPEGPIKLLRV